MPIQVSPLTTPDIPAAIEIIQRAFADDPYFNWVFDPKRFNKQRNHDSLEARCIWGISNALFYVAREVNPNDPTRSTTDDGRILGISCWLPPNPTTSPTPATWTTWLNNTLLTLRQISNNIYYLGRGGLNTARYYIWKAKQAEAQRRLWTDPRGYYFCNIVAVAPEAQGLGVGRKLFEVVLEKADEEGLGCYLESSKMVPNVEVYGRLGFEVKLEMECRDESGHDGQQDGHGEACMLYCMMREPRRRK